MSVEPPVDLGIAGLGPAVRIGSGGFADVYRAEQSNLRREVAVKVLRASANDAQARMRFERECHAVGAVSGHPNIVAVHEGGFTADGRAYLVMEYFPGGSLLDRIQRTGPLGPAEVTDIGIKIGRALGVAHAAGVLHRDVKPANILVSAYGEPALADFGIARVEGGQQTATGLVTASFAHASPEVLQGSPATAASDLYSLGSTLFELAIGQAPHFRPDDESAWALMNRVVSEPVADPATFGVPQPLAAVIGRATAHSPSDRHPSTAALVAQLEGSATAAPGPPPRATVISADRPVPPSPPAAAPPHPDDPANSMTMAVGGGTQQWAPGHGRAPSVDGAVAVAPDRLDRPADRPRSRRRWPLAVGLAAIVVGAAIAVGLLALPGDAGLEPVVLAFPAAAAGPLDAEVSYPLSVEPLDPTARYQLIVDDEPVGQPAAAVPAYVATAGRHRIVVEASREAETVRTEPVDVYALGPVPEAGIRVNLASVRANPSNWPAAIGQYDRLVEAGHRDLQILPSDRFPSLTPGLWNFFVPGFGDDRQGAEDYCRSHDLDIPQECFASFFDPDA